MGFIGKVPTPVPLTSSDITDGIITTAKIANSAVTSAKTEDGTNLVKISSQTASSSSSIQITSGIDSTYKIYKFEFINVQPATNDVNFSVGFSINGGSNYTVAKTGSGHQLQIGEDGSSLSSGSQAIHNSGNSTSLHPISHSTGNGSDEQLSGHMYLYNPSNTTFVKSYFSEIQTYHASDLAMLHTTQGFANTTSAIDGVKFQYSSGNINVGEFILYGVRT